MMFLNFKKKNYTCAMNRAKFPPVEISCISDSSAASRMPLSRGACCSLAGASLSITTAGFVSVNSTDSATDAAEKPDKEGEGAPRLRSSSPMICTGWMLDVLSAAWFLVALVASLALVAFERLCCSMLQSAQDMSSSVNCYSIALACQHQQCNQTRNVCSQSQPTQRPRHCIFLLEFDRVCCAFLLKPERLVFAAKLKQPRIEEHLTHDRKPFNALHPTLLCRIRSRLLRLIFLMLETRRGN